MNPNALKILSQVLTAMELGAVGYAAFQQTHAKVKAIIAEGRNPTDAEWDELAAGIQANSDIIQNS